MSIVIHFTHTFLFEFLSLCIVLVLCLTGAWVGSRKIYLAALQIKCMLYLLTKGEKRIEIKLEV